MVRIRNNDDERSIDIDDAAAAEHTGAVEFPVTLSGPDLLRTVRASWKTASGSAAAGRDFTDARGTVEFAPGETAATIRVELADDALDEADETFTVTLSDPENGVFDGATTLSATGTIHDNDLPAVSIRTGDAIAAQHDRVEEGEDIEFVLTRAGETDKRLQASFTIQFNQGQGHPVSGLFDVDKDKVTVTVRAPEDDILNDPSDRRATATVTGKDGVYAVGHPNSATVTIYDDDREKAIFLGGHQYLHFTGVGDTPELWFGYTVSNVGNVSTDGPVRVESDQFETVACGDAVLAPGVVNLYCSNPTYTVTQADVDAGEVTIRATATDGTTESNELEFRMMYQPSQELTFGQRYEVTEGQVDDFDLEVTPIVSIEPTREEPVYESDGFFEFDVVLSRASGHVIEEVEIYMPGEGTAKPGNSGDAYKPGDDYVALGARVVRFAPGQTRRTVSVPIYDDDVVEDDETFVIELQQQADAFKVGLHDTKRQATGTIVDDDASAIHLSVDRVEVAENGGEQTVTVTAALDRGLPLPVAATVAVEVGSGAVGGRDFEEVAAFSVEIAAGDPSATATFELTPVADDVDEEDREVAVAGRVTAGPNLTVNGTSLTITDDDTRGVTVSETALIVAEGPFSLLCLPIMPFQVLYEVTIQGIQLCLDIRYARFDH